MLKLLPAIIVATLHCSAYTQYSLEKIWLTDSTFRRPESVLYDSATRILYVSNMETNQKQEDDSISKLTLDGKTITNAWISGMTATKWLGIYKNRLYGAEQTRVAVIGLKTDSLEQRIPLEGAVNLNDITIDRNGIVYVSNSRADKIHKIEKRLFTLTI